MQFFSTAQNPFTANSQDIVVESPAAGKWARAGMKDDFVHFFRVNRTERGIGTYPSLAMQVSFPYFSAFELALLQFLDMTIGCIFWPQPLSFNIIVDGKPRIYTPDCGVLLRGARIMVETKFQKHKDAKKFSFKWPAIQAEVASCNYKIKHFNEDLLLDPLFADRLQALQRYRRFELDPFASHRLDSLMVGQPSWRLDQVLKMIASLDQPEEMFFASVIRRKLYADLWGPINEATEVFSASTAPTPALFRD